MAFGGFWWLFCWLLVAILLASGGFWWLLVAFASFCWLLLAFVGFWWLLVAFASFWWLFLSGTKGYLENPLLLVTEVLDETLVLEESYVTSGVSHGETTIILETRA